MEKIFAEYAVLGAGIAGLGFACEMSVHGKDVAVFEKESYVGGLCHSFKIDQFTFDTAVHLSFTEDKSARCFFDKTEYIKHIPKAGCFYEGKWLQHPVINNIFPLAAQEKEKCLISFLERNTDRKIENYEDWLVASYGREFADRFYQVYTRKYWTTDAKNLGTGWIGNRLANPDIRKIVHGAFSNAVDTDFYAKEMRYPCQGGYETFIKPLLSNQYKIYHKKKVIAIIPSENLILFEDGSQCQYKYCISSLPLPELVHLLKDMPQNLQEESQKLVASKISLVSIGLNRKKVTDYLWFYIYDKDVMAARVYSPSLKSTKNTPEGTSSLQFEIYHDPTAQVEADRVVNNVLYALKKMNLCEESDILFADYRLIDYGNVIFVKNTEEIRDKLLRYISSQFNNIYSIGRFGKWEYYWSDQSLLSGCSMAKQLL